MYSLNYSLIFGHFGLPEIGGVGAGYGIAGACWTNFILFSAMVLFHPKLKGYRIYKDWVRPKWQYIREQLQIGLPIGSSYFLKPAFFQYCRPIDGALWIRCRGVSPIGHCLYQRVLLLTT